MDGRARAPGAATILNAIATGTGSAFAIDRHTTASVSLDHDGVVSGTIAEDASADTELIEACVRETIDRWGSDTTLGGHVKTDSELPMAAGLKSSSAAANATVLATLDALGMADTVDRREAVLAGVSAAREAGVTITGALDDASASMLGGVTLTDNSSDRIISQEPFDRHVVVHTPPHRAYSADTDVAACRRIAPVAETVESLVRAGEYEAAMTVNGFAFAAALDQPTDLILAALPDVDGVSLSGTGPSTVAVGDVQAVEAVATRWADTPGTTRCVRTDNAGATIL